jgi:hypothetical protein
VFVDVLGILRKKGGRIDGRLIGFMLRFVQNMKHS